jgi:tRNA pseudouridine55 synthase
MPRSDLAGILNLYKPSGMTSRDVVDLVVRAAGTGRVGHAGTLDPLATGVLVVSLGWTTRLVPFIQELRKVYCAEFLLGSSSDTDDVTGEVQMVAGALPPSLAEIAAALPEYVGRIVQIPPRHSAVHVNGRRAYKLARSGIPVEMPPREVDIFRLELLEYDYPRFTLEIECGSGTYVRALGRDLGGRLGCGAVMSNLERRAIGPFHVDTAVSPRELTAANLASHLLPPASAVRHLPRYDCPPEQLPYLRDGRPLPYPGDSKPPQRPLVAIVTPDGALAALAEFNADRALLQPRQVYLRRTCHA